MSWTKRQLVVQAFEEIGLAAYVFDLTPDQLASALRRLDAMVAGWAANGIRIAYPLPSSPQNSDINADTGTPDWCNEALYLGLALRLAPAFGKAISPETRMLAAKAYSNLLNQASVLTHQRQAPQNLPRGQGTKPWRNFNDPFTHVSGQSPVDAGSDGPIDF